MPEAQKLFPFGERKILKTVTTTRHQWDVTSVVVWRLWSDGVVEHSRKSFRSFEFKLRGENENIPQELADFIDQKKI